MPKLLMQLMRHESIDTNQAFYVMQDAEATADALWKAHDRARCTGSGSSDPEAQKKRPRIVKFTGVLSGQTRARTGDTWIFSATKPIAQGATPL